MLKRFFAMLFRDLHWKILSVLAALLLWFLAMNMNNPIQNRTVVGRLALSNLDILATSGIMLLNEADLRAVDIQVVMRATRSELDMLQTAMLSDRVRFQNMLQVSVDFRAVNVEAVLAEEGESVVRLDVSANLYPGLEYMSIRPSYIEIVVDAIARESFFVSAVPMGEVPPGFELLPISLTNNFVTVTASRTNMREIESVQAYVDITGLFGDVEQVVQLNVYDSNGLNITERTRLSMIETTALVRMWPVGVLDLSVTARGQPAADFAVADVVYDTQGIEVIFTCAEQMDEFVQIEATIDITGASEDAEFIVGISEWLPDGVMLRPSAPGEISVYVVIEPIEQRFIGVPRDDLRIRGVSAVYQVLGNEQNIMVGVIGPMSIVRALSGADVDLELDLRMLGVGIHSVPLAVDLPTSVYLTAAPPSLSVQIHAPALEIEIDDAPPEDVPYVPEYVPEEVYEPPQTEPDVPEPDEGEDEDEDEYVAPEYEYEYESPYDDYPEYEEEGMD